MEQIIFKGENGFIKITLGEIFAFPNKRGLAIRSIIGIKSYGYSAKGSFWTTTHEVLSLYRNLKKCNELISGEVKYTSYESNVYLLFNYTDQGQVFIKGRYIERADWDNALNFSIKSDQSYITETLNQLRVIVDRIEPEA